LHSGTCTNAECKFPHLSEKEIVDRAAAYNADKAALHVAGPCILLDEESIKFWNIAGVCIDDISEDWENRTTVVPGGHKGDIIFEIHEADEDKDLEKGYGSAYRDKLTSIRRPDEWNDPTIHEITALCAEHKAELMHKSVVEIGAFALIRSFELHGYAVQTMVWDRPSGRKRHVGRKPVDSNRGANPERESHLCSRSSLRCSYARRRASRCCSRDDSITSREAPTWWLV
jgi:hypothetical protein